MIEIVVREMYGEDTEAVCQIMADCYRLIAMPDGITPQQLQRLLDECCDPAHVSSLSADFACFVAACTAEVVGFVSVGAATIEDLFVAPAKRRSGVGRTLFRQAECAIQAAGHRRATLSTTGYGLPFYLAMGMEVSGTSAVPFGPLAGATLVKLTKLLSV